jgi:hypothetical protein
VIPIYFASIQIDFATKEMDLAALPTALAAQGIHSVMEQIALGVKEGNDVTYSFSDLW